MNGEEITPELLLQAYAYGLFPMAEGRGSSRVFWMNPKRRGIIPLNDFNVPRKLRKLFESGFFQITMDKCFNEVIRQCADVRTEKRKDSWINDEIIAVYTTLHEGGNAHSVEVWREGSMVGGLYGVAIGGAFFGESMFSRESGASKVALVYLVEKLKSAGFVLLDTQFVNEHLKQFGVIEIGQDEYLTLLKDALQVQAVL